MKAAKPKFNKSLTISKNKKTLLSTNPQNSKMKWISFNKQSSKRKLWLRTQKASKKWSGHKSTKKNISSERLKTTTLLKPTTKVLSIIKMLNLITKQKSPKRNSISPLLKREDSKKKLISWETNSSLPNKHSMELKNKMKCLWILSLKFPEKSSTGKN